MEMAPTVTHHTSDEQSSSPLLSPELAGAYIRIHHRTLKNWRVLGRGPRYVRVGRRAFYRRADLDAWLEAHAYDSTRTERRKSA
jgi:hypothetical protein